MTALAPALVSMDHVEAAATVFATLDRVDDSAGFNGRLITVSGTVTQRAEQALAQLAVRT